MTNERHEEIIRNNAHHLYSGGQLDRVDAHYANNARVETPGASFDGRAGVRKFVGIYREAFPDMNVNLRRVFSAKNFVASQWSFEGTHTGALDGIEATGNTVRLQGASIALVVNNQIEEERHYWDRAEIFRQLGLLSDDLEHMMREQ